ncbi:MAG: hypothetical protein AAGE52_29170 [Myxococcota bacterium]
MEDLPTLLLLGDGEPMRAALEEALVRHAAFAEASDATSPVAAVMVSAPDLVVLMGDAAKDHDAILRKLAANPMTRPIPVALLTPPNLGVRLSAARRGVAVVERTASVDEMAKQIAQLARTLPETPARAEGAVGEATLQELLDIVRQQLEGGILSVAQQGGERAARFVLAPGRNVDAAVRDFVRRIKPLLKEDHPLHYEFDGEGSGLAVLEEITASGDLAQLKGRRILLVEDDASIADTLCQELRSAGSVVSVCTTQGRGLQRARALDPEVVLVDEGSLEGASYEVLRTIRRDAALRWASLLVLRLDDLTPEHGAPRLDHLAANIVSLLAPDREIAKRARELDRFEARLATIGPTRLLRSVASAGSNHHVTIRHPRVTVEVAIAEGLIAGAKAVVREGEKKLAGTSALAAVLAIGSGRVTIERRSAPAMANLLTPVADAFVQAAAETPPLRPSLAPEQASIPTPAPQVLLSELKDLLQKMKAADGISADLAAEIRTAEVMLPEARPKAPERSKSVPPPPSDAPTRAAIPEPAASARKKASAPPPPPPPVAKAAAPPPPLLKLPTPKKERKPPQRRKTVQGMPAPKVDTSTRKPKPVASVDIDIATEPLAKPPPEDEFTNVDVPDTGSIDMLLADDEPEAPAESVDDLFDLMEPQTELEIPAPALSAALPSASLPPAAPPALESPADAPRDLDVLMAAPPADALAQDEVDFGTSKRGLWIALGVLLLVGAGAAAWWFLGRETTEPIAQTNVNEPPAAVDAGVEPVPTAAQTPEPNGSTTNAGENADAENADAENTDAENTDAENTDAENTDAESTDAENTDAENTDAEEPDEEFADGQTGEDLDMAPARETRLERINRYISAGNFYRGRRRWTRARARYRAALRLAPRNGRALAGLTKIALAQGRAGEAVGLARRLVRANPGNAGSHVLLGDALKANGNRTAARNAYQAALRRNSRHRTARARLNSL